MKKQFNMKRNNQQTEDLKKLQELLDSLKQLEKAINNSGELRSKKLRDPLVNAFNRAKEFRDWLDASN